MSWCGTLYEHIWLFRFSSRLILYLKIKLYHLITHVFGKVHLSSLNRESTRWVFQKHFWMFSYASRLLTARGLRSKCRFSGPVIIRGTCDMTLHLEGVHICHILKQWLRRPHHYSLSSKKWDENIGQNGLSRRNLHGRSRQPCRFGTNLTQEAQRGPPFVIVAVTQYKVAWSRFVANNHYVCVLFSFDIHS